MKCQIRRLIVLALALGSVWLLPPSLASAQEPPGLPLISISADQTSAAEGQDATFTLTRTGNTSTELTVRVYSIEFFHPDGSGSLDNPTGQYHQVTFDSGSDTATLTVTTDFDGVPESSDSLDAVISPEEGSPYRNGDPGQASVAITDVARVVTITADQTTVTEGDTVTFTLTRTGPTTKAVVVNVSVSDPGSFLRGNHWQPNPVLPTEVIFEVESSTTTISLQTKDDLRDIPDNNLTVTVNSGIGYSTASDADSASIAVTDNDVAPTLDLSIDSDSVEEGETLTITLQITGGSQNPVEFAVVRGYEGEPDRGYTGLDGSETGISWSVDTDDNDLDEEDRVYRLEILPAIEVPEGAQSEYWTIEGESSVSATVRDNDLPLVWIEPQASSYPEYGFSWFRLHRVGRTDHDLEVMTKTTQAGHDVDPFYWDYLDRTRVYTIDTSSDFENIAWILAGNDGDEDEGALTMQLLQGSDYRIDPERSSASVQIVDLDPPPTLSIENARVSGSEDSGFIKFTVSLAAEHASRRTVTVDYATIDGTAEAGPDYTETSGVLTFDPLQTTGVISVPVNDDDMAEPDETFTLILSNLSNAVLANELIWVSATGTIEDNEPTVSAAARSAEVTEGAPVVFDLTRTGSTDNELTVILGVLALNGLELADKVQSVTFAAGDNQATWEHATVDNDVDEPDRDVIAALTPPSSSDLPETYHVNQATATVTVKDNDLPLVTIAAVGSDQTEGEDAEFTLTRQGVLSDPLTVDISVTGGDDFISGTRPTTATFATGAATHTLTLTTEDDAPVDDDGMVVVEVTTGSGYRVGDPGSAAVALFDSERSYPVVSILANKGVVDEGDDVVFTLSRSAYGLDQSLTVRVKVSVTTHNPERLQGGVDAAVSNEEVVFDAGSLTASLVHPTVDEVLNDGNSAVWAVIQLGQYSIRPYPGEAVVWVRDDDIPTVTMTPETGEVFENPPNATEFTVVRTGDTTNWLRIKRVSWYDARWPARVLSPVGAALDERNRTPTTADYGLGDFGPGEATNTFRRAPRATGPLGTTAYFEVLPFYCGDDIPGDCGYRPQYKVGKPKSSTIEVLNRNMGVRVVADQASVDEGGAASFTLHRYGGTFIARVSSLTARVQVTQNGEFIEGVPPQTVTFTGETVDSSTGDVAPSYMEGDTTAVVTIQTVNDMVDEANGAITLTILDPDPELYGANAHSYEVFGTGTFLENSGWTNVATVEVLDDDVAGFSIADASADEADGSMQFTVTLPGSTFETSVDWATKDDAAGDDPATEGKDYAAANGTLTFAPGDTSETFTVTLNDDDVKEKDETFTIQLANPVNAALTDATAIGTIDDDDFSQAVFITLDAGTADGVEEGEDVVFNLERHTWLGGTPSQDVARGRLVVGLEIALEGDFVREPVPATAVFEAGVWVATVTVPTIDDALFEPAGSVSLKLESQGFGLLSNANPVEADVYDNDMPVSVADAETDEGDGELTFTISLQEPAVIPVEVEVATVDGTATSHGVVTATDFGKDFTAKSETLTFDVGEQDKQFTVTLVDDRWDEAVESFTVELRNPSYARLQDASATGTILDNDPQMVATLVPPENKRIDEDTIYPVRFVVELDDSQSLASERGAYLNWTVTPDTATHGEDYVESGGSIVIPPGHLTGAFEVHLVDDDLFETRNELFTVTLTRERWVIVDPDNSSRNIKIKDDDLLSAAVFAAAANVVEGSDATFHIRVSGSRPTEDVVVQYELGGTATSGDDYTAPSGTVTMPVGQLSVPIAIGTTADNLHDPNETLVVSLTDITSVGRTVRSNAETKTATVTILDEGSPVVSVSEDDGTEGDALQFTVTLSTTTDAPVEVQWETEQYGSLLPLDERATQGVDYEPGGGTVTIPPGEDNGTILVATTQDDLAENTERFLVKLTGASRVPGTGDPENVALGAFSAEGSILDDDVAPTGVTLSATPVAVPEGTHSTELAITATLNTTTALTEDASVHVTVAGGTATEDEDYTATEVTLIIAAGDLSRTGVLNLTPLDDEIAEGDETVLITGTVDGLDVTPAEVTITDDDYEPTGITLRVTPNSVGEGDEDTVLNVKAVLAGGDRRPVDTTVTLSVEGAALPAEGGGTTTAASDDDFSFSPVLPEDDADPPGQITLTIPAGEGNATARLTLSLVDDLIVEGDETLQVSGTADGLPVTAAPLTIADNDRDPTGIQLSVTPWDLVEGEGAPVLLVTATLTGGEARTADTLVSLSVHGLSAVSGQDYTEPSNVTLTIPAESLTGSATLTLTLLDDDISEDSEELEVRGTNADPGLPVNGALVAIDDDDAAPTGVTLTLDKDQVPEDAGLQHLIVTGVLTGGGKRTVDTTVTLTVSSVTATDADYTYLPAELLIQSGRAEGTGTLLLVPTDDLIDEDDETLEVRGVVPGLTVSPQQVVITDNDSAGVTITPTSLTVLESQSNSYSVKLNTQPTADVTVAISGHAGTALTLSGTTLVSDSLTFTSENWSTPQTVAVNAGAVTADTDVTLVHGISGGDYGSVTAADMAVTVVDIPENQVTIQVGVTLSRQALTVPEGSSNTYEVVLGHQPTGDVTVTVTVDDTANNDVTTEEGSLVFTTANWNEPQTVTVRAAEDDDALTDSNVTVSHTVGGANYEGVVVPGLTVSITEDDAVGVSINPTTLTVTEGDAAGASYTVKLNTQPAGNVTIAISGHAGTDLTVSGTTLTNNVLTFTTENWGTAQTVKVKAAEDDDADQDSDVTLAHEISSTADTAYHALADQSVTVSITENDVVGVTINPTSLTVTEGDAAGASYTVVLATQPAGDVTVTISGHAGTDLTLSGTTLTNNVLTFPSSNWGEAQTVTVKAAEDEDGNQDADVTLVHAISSTDDSTYNALADQSVTVSITENDSAGVTISPTSLTVTEGDAAGASYTVKLTSEPAGNVTVTISGQADTDLTLSGTTLTNNVLTFTDQNWSTAQMVKVKAGEDDDATTDPDVTLVHDISSTDDSDYNALADQSVTVSITENDAAGVTINPTTLTVTEGDANGSSYTVKLNTQPAGDVTIAISGQADTDLTLSGTTLTNNVLTFTDQNWSTAQTVKVVAGEDDDATTDPDVTLAHGISSTADSAYAALADQSVTVSITENDAAGVTINPTTLTVTEGDATGASYTVVLTTQPAGDVTVTISGHAGTDLTLSGTGLSNDNKLTFTTDNWRTVQTVTVKAAEDHDATQDPDVTLAHAISSTTDTDYDALANQDLTVTVTDDDGLVTIAADTTPITEGASAAFTLTRQGNTSTALTVNVAVSQQGDYISGTAPTTVSFGAGNATASLSVATVDDRVDEDNGSITATLQSGTGYTAGTQGSAAVTVEDNDTAGVTINPTSLTVTEGDAAGSSYTVKLNTQPTGNVTVTISGHAGTDLTVSGTTLTNNVLTFTDQNWDAVQTVKVVAAEDDDATTDPDVTLAHAIGSTADTVYDALADQSVTVSITEKDAVGVTIDPTTMTVTEGDATGASYTVVLTSQPADDVTVTVSGHAGTDLTVSGTNLTNNVLTFTTENWGMAQTVTVKAAEDDDADQNADVVLAHAIGSTDDSTYHALADQTVTVSITENDVVGVTIDPTTLTVTEGDAAGGSYTVALTSQPAGDVTIAITGDSGTDLTLSGTALSNDGELTFTTENWGTVQTVTVKAAADADADQDADVTLAHAISSTDDSDYNALADKSVTVRITEKDEVAVTVTFEQATYSVAESDDSSTTEVAENQATIKVKLSADPKRTVTIPLAKTDQGGASSSDYSGVPANVTFQSGDTEKSFTFTATQDTVDDDGESVKLGFGTLPAKVTAGTTDEATVSITDDDKPASVTVNFDKASYSVAEGGTVTVKLTLSEDPEMPVTVPLTKTGQGGATSSDYSGVPASVTFNAGETEKEFTFRAEQDTEDDDGESVKLTFGTLPSGVTAGDDDEATVSITDDDDPAVTVSFEKEVHYTTEGASGAAGVEVLLSTPLQYEVTIPVTVLSQSTADTGDYLVDDHAGYASDPGLTFSPGETFGYIFIKAVLDTVDENTETVVLAFGTLPAGVSEGSPSRSTVEIKDAIQVSFADSSYMVEEGGAGVEVVVKLNKPSNNLRVPLTANGHAGADDSDFTGVPQEVVFKGDETEETFTFVAMEDSEEENGEMVRLGFGAFSEGIVAIFPDSAIVMIFDDDAGAPAPRHFAAYWPTQTSITLSWFTVETAAEYKLEFRKHGESDWTRISGDFDHLPSTSDHRDAFGVAAGLDCETQYDFRVSARGDGSLRNDGSSYPSTLFGSAATTSAQTGECAQEERVTNLLVSVEPRCATLTWTPPSGNRDTGYRVERYSYTDNRNHRSEPETLTEQANRVAARYEDCSAEYRTDGAEHEYIVTALDNNPEPDEEGAFGTAYTAILVFGPGWVPEEPRNVRLTRDTQSSRRLAWDAPRDPWLTTVRTARDGSGPQQVVTDPWTTGYRVERHEYRRTEDGRWFLPEFVDETLLTATMTVGEDSSVSQRGYSPDINGPYGELTQTVFTLSSGSYTVIGLYHPTDGGSLRLTISPRPPSDAPEDWILVIDGVSLPLEDGIIGPDGSLLLVTWFGQSLSWAVGQQVSAQLVERSDWKALRYGAVDDTGTSFTDSEDKGDRLYVYRVWAYNNRGLSRYSWRGDWAFNGGDPGGDPEPAGYVPPPPAQQQGGEAPSNTPATGAPAISGPPQVGQTLTVDTSGIGDADGMTNPVFTYRWVAGGVDIQDETDASYTIAEDDVGLTIQVWVSFTDDNGNPEVLTSVATAGVVATVPTEPLSLTVATGDQIQELDASWQAPESNGGSAVTSYRVQWKEAADSWDTEADVSLATETGTTHTVTGLTGGVEYAVRVMATNVAGDGPASTEAKGTPAGGVSEQTVEPENTAPTGLPSISGTPQVDQTLTADTSPIDDQDGLTNVSYRYQWIAGGSDIDGATGSSHTLTASEQGQTIQVRVTFTDDADNEESLTSMATKAVTAKPNSPATRAPAISGTLQVGETLTATTSGIADEDGLDDAVFSYQWIRSAAGADTDIAGATESTYTLAAADQGKTVKVRVTFTDDAGNDESLTSVATAAVTAKTNNPATGLPTISGTAQVGETLTASTSGIADEDGLDNASFSYQWIAGDTDISGATGSTYTLKDADKGKTIQVRVSFTDDTGNAETLTSAATATVEARPNSLATGAPTISGTAQVGETLTASTSGIADADGMNNAVFGYQWMGDNSDIAGATDSTYTLVADDERKTVRVRVSFTDDRGNGESLTSAATAAVAAEPNSPATGQPTISGTAQVGETLTASTSGIADDDGLNDATFEYQWIADNSDIAGATDSTYTLADSDEGKAVKVKVSFTDDAGNEESLTSGATGAVAPGSAPARPTGLSNTATYNSVSLTWDDPGDSSITHYQIFRRDRAVDDVGVFHVIKDNTGSAATTYTDDTVQAGGSYVYRVKAVNRHGASSWSSYSRADIPVAP